MNAVVTWEAAVQALRDDPDQREFVRLCYYDDPLAEAAERYHLSEEWQAVRPWLKSGGTALDVGAGRGIACYALTREGYAVTALEPDPSAIVGAEAILALSRERDLGIEVRRGVAEAIPAEDDSFDLVFARAALHHTRDLVAAAREFARVLKPGGRLIALREHVISRPEHLQAFLDSHPLHRLYGGENAFLLETYLNAFAQAGLQIEQAVGPLESPMNYAPHSLGDVQALVAERTGPLRGLSRSILGIAPIWRAAQPVLAWIDHRPGRLFSFLARKP